MPLSIAFLAAASPALCAANGVLLRDPLKPWLPALAHTTVLPLMSVMVTMVLLNEAWTWAMPLWTIRLSFFLPFFTLMKDSYNDYAVGAGRAAGVGLLPTPARRPVRVRALVF
jgi:hypothetical protein